MSRILEFEDKVVEKAVEKASKELNIPKEQLRYDVISYGSTGIFGLVAVKKAKIRVTLPDAAPPPKANREKKPAPKPKEQQVELPEPIEDEPVILESEVDPEALPMASSAGESDELADDADADSEEEISVQAKEVPAEIKNLGLQAVQRIIDAITDEATVALHEESDRLVYRISGGNSAILIGKRGQTLEAMQYLTEKVVNKSSGYRVRVQVDVEGYLEERKNRLEKMAAQLADKVKQNKKPITVGNLNAHDRRIIHIALKNEAEVRTQSMGEGFYRKLVIYPKKTARKSRSAKIANPADN